MSLIQARIARSWAGHQCRLYTGAASSRMRACSPERAQRFRIQREVQIHPEGAEETNLFEFGDWALRERRAGASENDEDGDGDESRET